MWESVRGAKSQARHPTHIVCPRFCHGFHPANGREKSGLHFFSTVGEGNGVDVSPLPPLSLAKSPRVAEQCDVNIQSSSSSSPFVPGFLTSHPFCDYSFLL
ncbi:hypothetical protein TNCV_2904351 [Trichonephila clavipes]|nr:hypothetical protein TNCV_2904351 [Trichonephila clavipes]